MKAASFHTKITGFHMKFASFHVKTTEFQNERPLAMDGNPYVFTIEYIT